MKKSVKPLLIIVAAIAAICGILALIWFSCIRPQRGTSKTAEQSLPYDAHLTRKQAVEDIDYAMKMMRTRHPAWLEDDETKDDAVEAKYIEEKEALPDDPTCLDVWRAISRIMHELYDGHTNVYLTDYNALYIDDFDTLREYGVPSYINGESLDDVFDRFLSVYQYECEDYAYMIFKRNILCNKNNLEWVGVDTSNGVVFTYETENGKEDVAFSFVPYEEVKVTETDSDTESDWVYYDIDEAAGIGVFTLTECVCDDHYRETVSAFFDEVSKKNISTVVVDLRNNGGGNSYVGDEFLKYVDVDTYYSWPCHIRFGNFLKKYPKSIVHNQKKSTLFDGDIYVLTNVASFSAAKDFTMLVRDNDLGLVVGEPSGNYPDTYGDTLKFVTPNAKLNIGVSFKRWIRIDETKRGQRIMPDYPCESRDALDTVYELVTGKPKEQ